MAADRASPRWTSLRRPSLRRPSMRWRPSLRARLTLVATLIIGVGFVLGSVLLLVALDRALLGEMTDSGRARARDVANLVDTGRLPGVLPRAGGTVAEQVLDTRGVVVSGTPGAERRVPMLTGARLDRARAGVPVRVDGSVVGHPEDLRVIGAQAGQGEDRRTVLVASPLGSVERTEHTVTLALIMLGPLALAAVAAGCWFVIGSALRPVDLLRRGADEITGTQSTRRLPVPATQDELRRLAQTLNDMLDRLEQSSRQQRAFVADAAHELRSPLASMRTQLEVTRQHPHTSAWEDTADDVLAEVGRLGRLVDDLLLLTSHDEGTARARRLAPVDLADVADSVVERRSGSVSRTGSHRVVVEGDPDGLTRVVDNLVANACRHAASQVTVDVRHVGATVTLTVTDDGLGIAPEDRERVFERFTRLDEARSRDSGGSGLGLAIVREIVRAHRGTIVLEEAQPGLRVVVRLPAAGSAPRSRAVGRVRLQRPQLRA